MGAVLGKSGFRPPDSKMRYLYQINLYHKDYNLV